LTPIQIPSLSPRSEGDRPIGPIQQAGIAHYGSRTATEIILQQQRALRPIVGPVNADAMRQHQLPEHCIEIERDDAGRINQIDVNPDPQRLANMQGVTTTAVAAPIGTVETNFAMYPGAVNGFGLVPGLVDTKAASEKAKEILWQYLTDEQRQSMFVKDQFDIIGSDSGERYTINLGHSGNVDHESGCHYCMLAPGLPLHDVLLAQKLMIESCESRFLEVANKFQ